MWTLIFFSPFTLIIRAKSNFQQIIFSVHDSFLSAYFLVWSRYTQFVDVKKNPSKRLLSSCPPCLPSLFLLFGCFVGWLLIFLSFSLLLSFLRFVCIFLRFLPSEPVGSLSGSGGPPSTVMAQASVNSGAVNSCSFSVYLSIWLYG